MPSPLRELSNGLPHGERKQYLRHHGNRQRMRNLRRLHAELVREQRPHCDWLDEPAPAVEDAQEPDTVADAPEQP